MNLNENTIDSNDTDDDLQVELINDGSVDINDVIDVLKNVFDPEIHYSIWDIGLIYKIEVANSKILITMTLTTVFCPEAQTLPDEVQNSVKQKFPDYDVIVELSFEPEWSVDNMNEAVRLKLGLL